MVANARSRTVFWWRRWSRECTLAFAGLALVIFVFRASSGSWSKEDNVREGNRDPRTGQMGSGLVFVNLTLLKNAKEKGAVCLDGSPPGYHLQKGFGSGSDNWVLHIEGGGWCDTVASCSFRQTTALGSSTVMEQVPFTGILSNSQSQNPDFFNWNRVKIRYCDGGSFSGDSENEVQDGSKIFFRGLRIWQAIMDDLLSAGLANARQALLSGCSAGGLATLIHCDDFRSLLPEGVIVKCLADAAFFLDEKDITGNVTMRSFYQNVVRIQGVAKGLQKDCISKMETYQCFFPQQIIKNIQTPVFIVNPAYDFWQIQHVLVPDEVDPHYHWSSCKRDINNCNPEQLGILHGFRSRMLDALSEFQLSNDGGMFINSCFAHCQTWMNRTWHSPNSPKLNNRTIAEAVGDWFFNRRSVKEVDCPFPCNPTCYNVEI